jgi:hypothetical protein
VAFREINIGAFHPNETQVFDDIDRKVVPITRTFVESVQANTPIDKSSVCCATSAEYAYLDVGCTRALGHEGDHIACGMTGYTTVMVHGFWSPAAFSKTDWPSTCPRCSGPAIVLFNRIECKGGCHKLDGGAMHKRSCP